MSGADDKNGWMATERRGGREEGNTHTRILQATHDNHP